MTSLHSSVRGCRPGRTRLLVGLWAAVLLLPMAALGFALPTASQPNGGPQTGNAGPPKITIQSTREREALRRQVNRFVAAVIAHGGNESLVRWNEPVCPLVAGLPRNFGEFILARISAAARDARAPLAGSSCQANLFVIATEHPEEVLKKWLARDPQIETRHGIEPVRSLLGSARPVRVWYNIVPSCGVGASNGSVAAAELNSTIMAASNPGGTLGPSYCQNGIDTHLSYGDVRSIYSAVIIVDTHRLTQVTIAQLADYLSLVGLASVRPDAPAQGTPTILRLFRDQHSPPGLTPWDQALLYSLYNTNQAGKLQLVDMESLMVDRIAR